MIELEEILEKIISHKNLETIREALDFAIKNCHNGIDFSATYDIIFNNKELPVFQIDMQTRFEVRAKTREDALTLSDAFMPEIPQSEYSQLIECWSDDIDEDENDD